MTAVCKLCSQSQLGMLSRPARRWDKPCRWRCASNVAHMPGGYLVFSCSAAPHSYHQQGEALWAVTGRAVNLVTKNLVISLWQVPLSPGNGSLCSESPLAAAGRPLQGKDALPFAAHEVLTIYSMQLSMKIHPRSAA